MDQDTLKRVAWLARIDADEAELTAYAEHFDRLLGFVERLQSADLEGVPPMAHPLDAVQRLRDDEVSEGDQRQAVLPGAPETAEGLFLVPRVIE